MTRIADWVCFGKWQINKIDFVEKDLIFGPVAESPVLITSSECTPAGEGHNYDKLFPHNVKVGISGLFIQVTFGESESLFCPVTKPDISLLSQLSCCTQACLYNDCTTPVQRGMLQIEWSQALIKLQTSIVNLHNKVNLYFSSNALCTQQGCE